MRRFRTTSGSASRAATRHATALSKTCSAATTSSRSRQARSAEASASRPPTRLHCRYHRQLPEGQAGTGRRSSPSGSIRPIRSRAKFSTASAFATEPRWRRERASRVARTSASIAKVWGITGLSKAKVNDSLTLNSITAYRNFDALEILDADGISLPVITAAEDAHSKQFSQELRLTWDNDGPITAFVGASYFNEKAAQRHAGPVRRARRSRAGRRAERRRLHPRPPGVGSRAAACSANPTLRACCCRAWPFAAAYLLPGAARAGIAANLKPTTARQDTSIPTPRPSTSSATRPARCPSRSSSASACAGPMTTRLRASAPRSSTAARSSAASSAP